MSTIARTAAAVALLCLTVSASPASADPLWYCAADRVDSSRLPQTADAMSGWFSGCNTTERRLPRTADAASGWLAEPRAKYLVLRIDVATGWIDVDQLRSPVAAPDWG